MSEYDVKSIKLTYLKLVDGGLAGWKMLVKYNFLFPLNFSNVSKLHNRKTNCSNYSKITKKIMTGAVPTAHPPRSQTRINISCSVCFEVLTYLLQVAALSEQLTVILHKYCRIV